MSFDSFFSSQFNSKKFVAESFLPAQTLDYPLSQTSTLPSRVLWESRSFHLPMTKTNIAIQLIMPSSPKIWFSKDNVIFTSLPTSLLKKYRLNKTIMSVGVHTWLGAFILSLGLAVAIRLREQPCRREKKSFYVQDRLGRLMF